MFNDPDRWAASVAASCPLSPNAVLGRRPDAAVLAQIEHRLYDTLGILGIIEDGGTPYLGVTAKKFAALCGDLNSLASRAARAFGIESDGAVPHGAIYAIDGELRPVEDWKTIKAAGPDLSFCRLFRIRVRA